MSAVVPRPPSRWRDDRGATSVVFAVVAMLLLAVAALAVDLTNLYAQRAVAQSRADAAAFAAAQALPDACDAVDAARQSLLDTGGRRSADEPAPVVRVYATDPRDEDGDPTTPPAPPVTVASARPDCSTSGASVQVSTPPRRVPFVFAGVFDLFQEGSGIGSTTVGAVARVRLAEPDLLPFVLPQGCQGDVFLLTTAAEEPPDPVPDPGPSAEPSPAPEPPDDGSCRAAQPDAGLGVLDSPVRTGESQQVRLGMNLRDGIDHAVEPLEDVEDPAPRCLGTGSPPGAVLDQPLPPGTPNCMRVTALLDTDPVETALDRRLDVDPTFDRCGTAPADAGAWRTMEACYLLEGFDRDDVLTGARGPASTAPLDESILADPRFFVVPELALTGPADDGDYVPVTALVGAFAVRGDYSEGTLMAFVFPLGALPDLVVDDTAERPRTLVLTRPVAAGPPGGTP